jgi:hypothetical protein
MAFHTNSRYYDQATVDAGVPPNRTLRAVKLRRLPTIPSDPVEVKDHDRLDLLAHGRFRDATMFWHIADANTELEANRLLERLAEKEPRVIQMPRS